jgi:capsular exopolysaccharide synthesis family protein
MSKIEKALNRARESGLQVVPIADAGARGPAGTAVVTAHRGAHPETIPHMAKNEVRMLGPADLEQRGIIRPQLGEDPAVQVIRALRTRIIQQCHGQNAVTLVTSVSRGCGGSFIARNLAAAFALDAGKTALLMDCDLANPSVHKLLRGAAVPGLADYLENPSLDIKDIIHPLGIARYRVITAGRGSETAEELFSSAKMKQLIDTVRERYRERFIIIDGPPMSKIADMRILSELADFVLVVAGYGRSTNAQITSCLNIIGEKKLLGLVFNEEPRIPRIR